MSNTARRANRLYPADSLTVESALDWAYRNGYSQAKHAIEAYCRIANKTYEIDYRDIVSFKSN